MSEKKESKDIVTQNSKMSIAKTIILFAVLLIVLTAFLAIFLGIRAANKDGNLEKELNLGAKYLSELKYEQAILAYESAIKIDPKSVEAYLGLADAHLGMGAIDEALKVLTEGYEQIGDERLKDKIDKINESIKPEEESQEATESDTPEWLSTGIPSSNIKDIATYTIGDVYLAYLTPQKLFEMFGEYDNTYIDENHYTLGEYASYDISYTEGLGETYRYMMFRQDAVSSWSLSAEKHSGWESFGIGGENSEIGFADIYFGDDYDTVMSKLGFTQEQAEWVKEGITKNPERNLWHCGGSEVICFEEYQFSYASMGGMVYGIGISPYGEEFMNETNRDVMFCFDADLKLISINSSRNIFTEE